MADWLSYANMDRLLVACRVPVAERSNPDVLAAVELASGVACALIEDGWREQGEEFAGVGPIASTELTERIDGAAVVLPFPPLSLVALVADDGTTVDVSALTTAGQVVTAATSVAGTLTYRAGYITAPEWAVGAGLIIAEHYYRTRLGGTRVDSTPGAGAGFIVPNAARALLASHGRTPLGFA